MKDFDLWNILKQKINSRERIPVIEGGDIWWCHIGKNIGVESEGKNEKFSRPVLIIKKHNKNHCITIPTTSKTKFGRFYYQIKLENKTSYLLLSQIRVIDVKRLYQKIGRIDQLELNKIKKAVYEINFH